MTTRYLLDVNVLLALTLSSHQHHHRSTEWMAQQTQWATTPITESAYIRLMTNPRVTGFPIAPEDVLEALRSMRNQSGHEFIVDDSSLAEPTIDTGSLAGTKQVTDLHLVNLAAAHGLVLATFDGSMSRVLATADRTHVQVIEQD